MYCLGLQTVCQLEMITFDVGMNVLAARMLALHFISN